MKTSNFIIVSKEDNNLNCYLKEIIALSKPTTKT